MTNRFKEALDCFVGGSWTDEQDETIREALTLAQEAEQLRQENDLLKQANKLLVEDGRKIPMRLGRSVEINTEGVSYTDTIYVGEPEFKAELNKLRKERDKLADALLYLKRVLKFEHPVIELAKKVSEENGNA